VTETAPGCYALTLSLFSFVCFTLLGTFFLSVLVTMHLILCSQKIFQLGTDVIVLSDSLVLFQKMFCWFENNDLCSYLVF
jgi:hypothetical protein